MARRRALQTQLTSHAEARAAAAPLARRRLNAVGDNVRPELVPGALAERITASMELAAEYIRMSTDQQQYSTDHQRIRIREYAKAAGLDVVESYVDEGRSGLTAAGRPELLRLLEDVRAKPRFRVVLVYDVTRWGRYQDADEGAYYEFLCRMQGIAIHYCNEQFGTEPSPATTIIKSVKRVMAAEYSRELSDRVYRSMCNLARRGFRLGGTAGYGLRRCAVDPAGNALRVLEPGEQKPHVTDHIILVPGSADEVETVRRIFRMYAVDQLSPGEIAATLNKEGICAERGSRWGASTVRYLLAHEKYIGTAVFARLNAQLKTRQRVRSKTEWIRIPDAFAPIVDLELFTRAQARRATRRAHVWKADELAAKLRDLLQRHGHLSTALIDETPGPKVMAYYAHYGSLEKAYAAVGYERTRTTPSKRTRSARPWLERFAADLPPPNARRRRRPAA